VAAPIPVPFVDQSAIDLDLQEAVEMLRMALRRPYDSGNEGAVL